MIEQLLERLKNMGCSKALLKRLHGPIGLPINAQTNAEIAVSIMGEIIKALRKI